MFAEGRDDKIHQQRINVLNKFIITSASGFVDETDRYSTKTAGYKK